MDKKFIVLVLGFVIIWFLFPVFQKQELVVNNPPPTNEMDYLIIPKLSLRAPIIYAGSTDEADIQQGLQGGVVHYHGTAKPSEIGNSYIVGHSSDFAFAQGNYKAVFAKLPELKIGDEVIVQRGSSNIGFIVTETKIVASNDLSVLSQETLGKSILTLQTSYPVGTANQRYIVVAKLANN